MRPRSDTLSPERALLQPAFLLALGVLLVNDHVLKGSGLVPGLVTGKLSDLAGLFFAPALFAAIVRARSRRAVAACHGATACVFAAIKVSSALSSLYVGAAALVGLRFRVVVDPTDLVALPMAWIGYLTLVPAMEGARRAPGDTCSRSACGRDAPVPRRAFEAATMLLALVGCVATSRAASDPPVRSGNAVLASAYQYSPTYHVDVHTGARKPGRASDLRPVAVAGGVAYVVEDGAISAVDVDTRKTLWSQPAAAATHGAATVQAGLLLVELSRDRSLSMTPTDWRLEAFSPSTGAVIWSLPLNGSRPPLTLLTDAKVVTLRGGDVLGIDAATGRVVFAHHEREAATDVGAADGRAVALVGKEVVVLDAAGAELGRAPLPSDAAASPPEATARHVALVRAGSRVYAVDVDERAVVWSRDHVRFFAEDDDVIATLGDQAQKALFQGFDAKTLAPRWSFELDEYVLQPMRVVEGVVVLLGDGKLFGHDGKTGKRLWTFVFEKGAPEPSR